MSKELFDALMRLRDSIEKNRIEEEQMTLCFDKPLTTKEEDKTGQMVFIADVQ